jgi:haloalkane dehalogenase
MWQSPKVRPRESLPEPPAGMAWVRTKDRTEWELVPEDSLEAQQLDHDHGASESMQGDRAPPCCGCMETNAWSLPEETPELVYEHEAKGRRIRLKDKSWIFVRDESPAPDPTSTINDNETSKIKMTVVMIHGVPASSFLYRKFFSPLVAKGYRAIALDLPGLGLSDKSMDREYSLPALAVTLNEILEHPGLNVFTEDSPKAHFVIHDIGGPITALYAADHPERVHSMTVLDTMLDLASFQLPFPMNIFPIPIIGDLSAAMLSPWLFRKFMHLRGVVDPEACNHEEAVAWVWLLNRREGRETFLKIMESFPWRRERFLLTAKILQALGKEQEVGMQIVWAKGDVAIPPAQAHYVRDHFNVGDVTVDPNTIHSIPGGHFFQLESPDAIVAQIDEFLYGEPATKVPPCLKLKLNNEDDASDT